MQSRLVAIIVVVALWMQGSECALAQVDAAGAKGNQATIEYDDFMRKVAANHPLVAQAKAYADLAKNELRAARGGFDPKVGYTRAGKALDSKRYYQVNEVKGVIPVRAGLNLQGGYEYNVGEFVDPERATGGKGLYFVGAELSLGRGLFIDSRRAEVLKGKVGLRVADAMVLAYANKLLLNAAKDYWTWYDAEREFGYLKNGVTLAKQRFDGVKEQVKVGEEAGIDSVEAKILYQDRLNQLKTAQLAKRNAYLKLSTYLWEMGYNAMKVDTAEAAPAFAFTGLPEGFFEEGYAEQVRTKSPELMMARGEIEQLKIDKRLAVEMLKPEIDLKYQLISKDRYSGIDNGAYYANNYRYGATVAMPLLLRKERGKLGQLKTKIVQQELDLRQAERNAENTWQSTRNELVILKEQILRQQDMVRNYEQLREAELIKFSLGESSLFLVNTRENKLLEAQIKLAELEQKWQKARATAYSITGQLLP